MILFNIFINKMIKFKYKCTPLTISTSTLGLDPALPFFATARSQFKLDSSDADFVDVIHTNAGMFGKLESCKCS